MLQGTSLGPLPPIYPYHALHMARVDGIDVCGPFFKASVRRNMSMGFWHYPRKRTFRETYQISHNKQVKPPFFHYYLAFESFARSIISRTIDVLASA